MYQNVQSFLSGIKYIVLEQEIHCFNMQIPEAVNKLPLQPTLAILVKLGEIKMIPLIILNKAQRFMKG